MVKNPLVGKIPWSKIWQPTPVFFSGKFYGQRSQAAYSTWGREQLNTTKQLTPTSIINTQESSDPFKNWNIIDTITSICFPLLFLLS